MVDRVDALEPYLEEWDDLAVANGRPFCAPEWLLAWWRCAAPAGARLRVALALDEGALVGVAPLYAERVGLLWRYRQLASPGCMRIEPLCVPGAERPVASAFAQALASARPRLALLKLDGLPAGSLWARLLAESWPGRRAPWTRQGAPWLEPTLRIDGLGFEEWLGSKSRNFRSGMGRDRRRLEERGAHFGTATLADLDRSLEALARLRRARVGPRKDSPSLDEFERMEKMLDEVGRELVPRGRMRLFYVAVAGETISAHLFLAAGGEVAYVMGGFDGAWAKWHPSLVTIVEAIEDGMARGEARVDFGPGDQPYKFRFADGQDELFGWTLIIARGPRSLLARLHVAAFVQLRSWLAKRIPDGVRVRLLHYLSRTRLRVRRRGSVDRTRSGSPVR